MRGRERGEASESHATLSTPALESTQRQVVLIERVAQPARVKEEGLSVHFRQEVSVEFVACRPLCTQRRLQRG